MGVSDGQVHTAVFKMGKQQGLTEEKKLVTSFFLV